MNWSFNPLVTSVFDWLGKLVIGVFLGTLSASAWSFIKRRIPARWAWNVNDNKTTHFIVSTSLQADVGVRFATGLGQVRAIGVLVPTFIRAYKAFDASNVLLSEETSTAIYGRDLVIIGGPKTNRVAREFLAKLPQISFTEADNSIVDRRNNKRFKGVIKNGILVEDYGLVIKTKNPFNPKSRCFLIMGSYTYGTYAAAVTFCEELTRLKYAWCQSYACLVTCTVSDHYVGKPQIIEFRRQ